MTGTLCKSPWVLARLSQRCVAGPYFVWPWHAGRNFFRRPAAHDLSVSAALGCVRALQLQVANQTGSGLRSLSCVNVGITQLARAA